MVSMETQLAQLEGKLNSTAEDVGEIKTAMRDIASSLRTLTVLEQKHNETRQDIEEIKITTKEHSKAIQSLQLHDAKNLWVERVVWVAVAGIIAAVIKLGI